MKYLKGFNDLYEAIDRTISYTPDEIKQMPEYQELLTYGDLKDTSSPAIAKSGNIRFQENNSGQSYTIFSNGYIRYQWIEKEVPWYGGAPRRGTPGVYVSPTGENLNDLLYGQPVKSKEDYIPKFEYIKRLIAKKRGDTMSASFDNEKITKLINHLIFNDAEKVKMPAIQKLIKRGIYNPDSTGKSIIKAADYGII